MRKIVFLLFFALFLSCGDEKLYRTTRIMMGTEVTLSAIGDEAEVAEAFNIAFGEIARVEREMSPYKEESDIWKLNHSRGASVKVTDETLMIVKRSKEISAETEGAFDISFLTVGKLWDFKKEPFTPPKDSDIKAALKKTGYRNITIDGKTSAIRFSNKDMMIGLGAIAKGYAIKLAYNSLKKSGVKSAVVDGGGDIQVLGDKWGKRWVTGLMHPRNKNIAMTIALDDGESVATSGDYERGAFYKGKRYHHILDTRTGYPTDTFLSVSVICSDAVDADAYATSIFVLGKERAIPFLKKKGLKVILVDHDLNFYASSNLKGNVKPLDNDLKINWF